LLAVENVEPVRAGGVAADAATEVTIRRFGPDEWQEFRLIRLAALRNAPMAFGSTYEESLALGEIDWRRRLENGAMFGAALADVDGPVGIGGGFVEPGEGAGAAAGTVELVSMWVRPTARGRGIGSLLVDAVVSWAGTQDARAVHLWVTEGNRSAIRTYERCGFTFTGERQQLPSDPRLTEFGMARRLS
jgi:GNAT superfamily N-acetyltransferase